MGGIVTKTMHPHETPEDPNDNVHLHLSKKEIVLIRETWSLIKEEGVQGIGEELFIRLFEVAPETFNMFEDFAKNPDWVHSHEFTGHCRIVMNFLRGCVQSLEKEESLGGTLDYIGLKHHGFGITQQQFDTMGVLLLEIMRNHLKEHWSKEAEVAWGKLYTFMATRIIHKMNFKIPGFEV